MNVLKLAALGAGFALIASQLPAVDVVVGDGTPASCTEAAFDLGLGTLSVGGGNLTFDCGPAPHTIVLTSSKPLLDDTGSNLARVDGGGRITLSGGNATRIFTIPDQANAWIQEITLTNGAAESGGAILVAGQFGNPRTELVLQNVTIRNSVAANWGGGIGAQNADLFIDRCRIVDNRADGASGGGGGGVSFNWGSLTVTGSEIARNQALGGNGGGAEVWNALASFGGSRVEGNVATVPGPNPGRGGGLFILGDEVGNTFVHGSWIVGNEAEEGGGIALFSEADLRLETTTVAANLATESGPGGGLFLSLGTSAYVTAVTFEKNVANYGGGARSDGSIELTNVTFSENDGALAGVGAGLLSSGDAELFGVTFFGNRGRHGGGFADFGTIADGDVVSLRNVLFVGNSASESGASCSLLGDAPAIGHSIWPDTTCGSATTGSNQPNTAVGLAPLAFSCSGQSAEKTPTHAIPPGSSAAVDAGVCDGDVTLVDQRGIDRPQGAACDVGAYERAAASCGALFFDGFESSTPLAWSARFP